MQDLVRVVSAGIGKAGDMEGGVFANGEDESEVEEDEVEHSGDDSDEEEGNEQGESWPTIIGVCGLLHNPAGTPDDGTRMHNGSRHMVPRR